MNQAEFMNVTIRLPSCTFYQGRAYRLRAEGRAGGFGLLPNHADFVTELIPSILTLVIDDLAERFFGIDEGMLIKRDREVSVIVRRAVVGDELGSLHQRAHENLIKIEDEERSARAALSRIEARMVRGLSELTRTRP
ncbi:hypothetical protein KVP09_03060 [Alcaligenaceae bacterium CGII-47]|nr:hypothetical protein [Alcaligenaceae bacterium CGII-47]